MNAEQRGGGRSTETRGSSRTIRTGGTSFSSTSTFTATNGAGLGASHQTGWTGIVARIMHLFAIRPSVASAART